MINVFPGGMQDASPLELWGEMKAATVSPVLMVPHFAF
jgi:hypothetical protein